MKRAPITHQELDGSPMAQDGKCRVPDHVVQRFTFELQSLDGCKQLAKMAAAVKRAIQEDCGYEMTGDLEETAHVIVVQPTR